jgi:prepilin-type N-terminal cleavage/methylation domain-containing protein
LNIAKNSKGFTLIEIVVVIAIAALILAAILIFVPQAQKSQRDSDRRSAAAKTVSKLTECASNQNGALCTTTGKFGSAGTLYSAGITGPGGTPYTMTFSALAGGAPGAAGGGPANGASCSTSTTMTIYANGTGGQYAEVCLEAGGGTVYVAGT